MWPAIWLLPVDGGWPPEIDIIELVGKEPNKVHHSFHWGPLRDGLLPWDLGQTATEDHVGENFDTVYHDFGMEWTPEGIVWTVDGKETHRFGRTEAERKNMPQGPMYLIMNLALGGFWPGPPGEDTKFPSTMPGANETYDGFAEDSVDLDNIMPAAGGEHADLEGGN